MYLGQQIVVLIGGSSGIGVARQASAEGTRLIVTGRDETVYRYFT
jgi:short-subunit dehydrogenase involved in D-alanine esterification of teichoic acids